MREGDGSNRERKQPRLVWNEAKQVMDVMNEEKLQEMSQTGTLTAPRKHHPVEWFLHPKYPLRECQVSDVRMLSGSQAPQRPRIPLAGFAGDLTWLTTSVREMYPSSSIVSFQR